jgi:iron-sulfur cluster repair protein YtfE (RIC family)
LEEKFKKHILILNNEHSHIKINIEISQKEISNLIITNTNIQNNILDLLIDLITNEIRKLMQMYQEKYTQQTEQSGITLQNLINEYFEEQRRNMSNLNKFRLKTQNSSIEGNKSRIVMMVSIKELLITLISNLKECIIEDMTKNKEELIFQGERFEVV